MTSKTSTNTGWRRAVTGVVASGALAAGLMIGVGATPALAEPATDATSETEAAEAPPMTADQVLAIIEADYDMGAGGGQLANLIHDVMQLRQQGFMPSNSNREAIVAALDKRPNQAPLVSALQATRSFQLRSKLRSEQAASQQGPVSIGMNTLPPGNHGSNLPVG